jgi:uncharacterized protein
MDQTTDWVSLHAAVAHRDPDGVRRLLARDAPTEERNEIGATPLIEAASTDQFVIAEMLIAHGANIWAQDRFGVTAPYVTSNSRLPETTPEGAARMRVIAAFRERGFPWPPPSAEAVQDMMSSGQWPPRTSLRQ